MTYDETELYKNSEGVFDVRVIGHTVKIVADTITSISDTGTIFCKNTGLVHIGQLSPANTDQINAVQVASQGEKNMLTAGENLITSLQEPEYL